MNKNPQTMKRLLLSAMAVCINVTIGSAMTSLHVPFLYLDAIGTIFIAFNFDRCYGILTGLCTNLVLAILFGPLALPFSLVSMTIAIVASLASKKGMDYKKAVITGILLAGSGALVSAPIRLLLFGGFEGVQKTASDILVFSLRASGKRMITAAYWGAFVDSFFDKIISCLLAVWLSNIPQLQPFLKPIKNQTLSPGNEKE